MASPTNIRVTAGFPFPPLVVGGAPVQVTKANGVWTISLNVPGLVARVPSVSDLSNEYWIVYDAALNTYFKVLLSSIGVAGANLQRFANASLSGNAVVVAPSDQWINFSVAAASTCALPSYGTRNGAPLTFYNSDGSLTGTNKLRISAAGSETIGGAAFVDLVTPRALVTLIPMNDGTSTGWALR